MSAAAPASSDRNSRKGKKERESRSPILSGMSAAVPASNGRKRTRDPLLSGEQRRGDSIGVEDRVEMLTEIVRALKSIDSTLRSRSAKGFDWLPTMDEQRLLSLVLGHVDSCLLLYYTALNSPPPSSPKERKRRRRVPSARELEKRSEMLGSRIINGIIRPLAEYRRLVTGFDADKARPKAKDIAIRFKNGQTGVPPLDITRSRGDPFVPLLVDVLHTLDVLVQQRDYAPPSDDEICGYKEMRRQACSTLIYVRSRAGCDPEIIASLEFAVFPGSYPQHLQAGLDTAPTFFPFGHKFARLFDLMQLRRSLFGECRNRLVHFLSTGDRAAADFPEGDCGPIASSGLIRWKEETPAATAAAEGVIKTRLECLEIILAKLVKIASFTTFESELTDRELHLYAHLAEHVRASRFLSIAASRADRKETCMVNIANIKEVAPIADVDGLFTREQYLEDIMSYLRAFKPLFSAVALTMEEIEAYRNIWKKLGSHFLWCTRDKPMEASDTKKAKKKKPSASLKDDMSAIHERALEYIEEVEKQEKDILALIFGTIISPEEAEIAEARFPKDAFKLSELSKEKLEKFLGRDSTGRVKMLDCLLVILRELYCSGSDFDSKLTDAVIDVDEELRFGKNFAMLEREVMNAYKMMSCDE